MTRFAFALLTFLSPAVACAQAVYECPGQGGPVFSDTPCPGGKRMDLGSPNVIDTNAPPAQQAPTQPSASAYTSFTIVSPEDGGTIHTNTGQFQVSVALSPALQGGNGISVSLDGTQLPTLRYSLEFDVTQEEWESAAAANVQHVLQASVLDRSGNTLIAATPVQFYVHRAFIRQQQR
ncbi:MAG TPA: DUF4124 domain-containing protein [Burkholderiales bacterium]|nr:DUF4124 domain-containing protein [Burkholderiales bacterium]